MKPRIPKTAFSVGLTAGLLLMLAGPADASQRAVACPGSVEVAEFKIDVARSKTDCRRALAVTRAAYNSFAERRELGDHGIFHGFKCQFGSAVTPDFSRPDGPILYCRSWNRYVVASAEPLDPPTNWSFDPAVLSEETAVRSAAGKIVEFTGRRWRTFSNRAIDCSNRLGSLARRCHATWSSGSAMRSANLVVRMIPRRWDQPRIRVTGTITKRGSKD